jgi:hypothetical protein
MEEKQPASGEDPAQPEGPFRRAYAWPILWGPWVTSVIGLVLLGFGMAVNSPVPVRVTALGLGALTIIAGLLLPRIHGAMELSPTGFKGQIGGVPAALVLAHRAAEIAIPEDEPDRDERANDAVLQAIAERLRAETDAAIVQEQRRISAIYAAAADRVRRPDKSRPVILRSIPYDVDVFIRSQDEPPPDKHS